MTILSLVFNYFSRPKMACSSLTFGVHFIILGPYLFAGFASTTVGCRPKLYVRAFNCRSHPFPIFQLVSQSHRLISNQLTYIQQISRGPNVFMLTLKFMNVFAANLLVFAMTFCSKSCHSFYSCDLKAKYLLHAINHGSKIQKR